MTGSFLKGSEYNKSAAYWTNKVAEVTRVPTALETASIAASKTMEFLEHMLERTMKFMKF